VRGDVGRGLALEPAPMTDAIADLLAAADELTDPRRHVEVQ
jgi:hypothetical protein